MPRWTHISKRSAARHEVRRQEKLERWRNFPMSGPGVFFTPEQNAKIREAVRLGNLLEAQRTIIDVFTDSGKAIIEAVRLDKDMIQFTRIGSVFIDKPLPPAPERQAGGLIDHTVWFNLIPDHPPDLFNGSQVKPSKDQDGSKDL